MLSLPEAEFAAIGSGAALLCHRGLAAFSLAAFIILSGCSPPASPLAGADPADPGAKVGPSRYRSAVGAYSSARPTAPTSWREQNDNVAPKPEPKP